MAGGDFRVAQAVVWRRTCNEHGKKRVLPMNPLRTLHQFGQSVWLDNISRGLITSGRLQRLINEDGLSGVTSNPTIFAKAIGDGSDYDPALERLLRVHPGVSNQVLVERL